MRFLGVYRRPAGLVSWDAAQNLRLWLPRHQGTCSKINATVVESKLRQALADIRDLVANHRAANVLPNTAQSPEATLLQAIEAHAMAGLAAPVPQRIAIRSADGPISGEAVTTRMVAICGCKGAYACDCVSIENQARRELWTERNLQLNRAA